MPKFLEKILERSAAKKGLCGKDAKGYVFGAMNNAGAMKGSKETPKGAAMQRKHDAKQEAQAAPKLRKSRGKWATGDTEAYVAGRRAG